MTMVVGIRIRMFMLDNCNEIVVYADFKENDGRLATTTHASSGKQCRTVFIIIICTIV